MDGVSNSQMTNRDGNSCRGASEDTLGDHLHRSANNQVQLGTEAATMKPEWQFTENPFLPINDVSENLITSQPLSEARSGVLRVTEMLKRINNEAGADLRGQNLETEERLEEAVSRRSSGADSGVGNMEDMEIEERSRRGECCKRKCFIELYENVRLQSFNDFRLLKMQLCRTLVMQSFRWYMTTESASRLTSSLSQLCFRLPASWSTWLQEKEADQ